MSPNLRLCMFSSGKSMRRRFATPERLALMVHEIVSLKHFAEWNKQGEKAMKALEKVFLLCSVLVT